MSTPTTAPNARGVTGPKLHIDWTACDGRGLCVELLPEIFDRDEWGYPVSRRGKDPQVPPILLDDAREAVASCPKRALTLL